MSFILGELQPLDLSINSVFKDKMKAKFASWYALEMAEQKEPCTDPVDLRASLVKPLHARWLIEVLNDMTANSSCLIEQGFAKAGILEQLAPEMCPSDLADTDVDC